MIVEDQALLRLIHNSGKEATAAETKSAVSKLCSSGESFSVRKDSSLSDLHLVLGEVLGIAIGIWVPVNLSCPHLSFG